MNRMTISQAITILSPINGGSIHSDTAYLFTQFVNEGKTPNREEPPMTADKRRTNLAIAYANEYLGTGKVAK